MCKPQNHNEKKLLDTDDHDDDTSEKWFSAETERDEKQEVCKKSGKNTCCVKLGRVAATVVLLLTVVAVAMTACALLFA